MNLTHWDILLWISGYVGNICLMFVLLKKKRYKSFPWFALFLANELVQDPFLALVQHYGSARSYFYAYWSLDVLDSLLLMVVIYELAKAIVKAVGVQGAFKALELRWVTAVLVLFA